MQTKENLTLFFIGLCSTAIILGYWYFHKPTVSSPDAQTPVTQNTLEKSYTKDEVSRHADANSCWSIIGGSVYDLTSEINRHPGGAQAILSVCGKDGTVEFQERHSGEQRVEEALSRAKIGILNGAS